MITIGMWRFLLFLVMLALVLSTWALERDTHEESVSPILTALIIVGVLDFIALITMHPIYE